MIEGKIHSIETCGTVDGPGIRYVIFTQGCPLRCQYCHNPDTWNINNGKTYTVDELMEDILKYKSYMKFSNGGVTISGGEPLLQPEFVKELFIRCKEEGIHTALDTSGFIPLHKAKEVLEYTDLVMLDIKNMVPERYKEITSVQLAPTLDFARYLEEQQIATWIRYVLVPGLSDNDESLHSLGNFLKDFKYLERVQLLPFHKMGEYKWEELGHEYKLADTDEPTAEQYDHANDILATYKLPL